MVKEAAAAEARKNLTSLEIPEFRSSAVEAHGNIFIRQGGKIRLSCPVKSRSKATVTFYHGDQQLKKSDRYELTGSSLRIENALPEDSGRYRCEASNTAGSKSLSFNVTVIGSSPEDEETGNDQDPPPDTNSQAPYWTNKKKMQKKLHAEPAGNTVQFKCAAAGAPLLKVDWYKNGEIIRKGQRIGGYKFRHHNQLLVLASVVVSDEGSYRCVVHNDYGSINYTYKLDVEERSASPPILQGMDNQTAVIGRDVTFHCKVYSDAHPHVQWLKRRPTNTTATFTVIKKAGVNTTDADLQKLTLKNVTLEDAGIYTCLAGNSIGISHISAWLTVIKEPEPTEAWEEGVQNETNILMIAFGGVVVVIVVFLIIYLLRARYNSKDPPQLVPIPSLGQREMSKMEEPVMLYGNEQAWRRMCLPHTDHIEINIQPDLQWELKREDILLHERIDEGFFGQVFRADLIKCQNGKKEKIDAAVKMLKGTRTEKDMLDLLTEMDQMKRIGKHKNIINLLGVCTQNGILWLVTEYAQQGNLRDYLRRNRPLEMQYHLTDPTSRLVPPARSQPLSSKDLMSAAYQVVRGMEYLAQKKCVHRDLAARNVLVTDDYVMKIADFGLARDIRCNDYYRKHTRGHLPYKWMALEAMADNIFTHATDVWSFGVLLWEIFTLGGSPYPGVKTNELVRFLRQGERLEHPQFASPELYRLMRDCWEESPQKRPKFRQLVEDLDRMLAESSSEDYIDLGNPMHDVSPSDTDESDDDVESSRDSANATAEDSDSVFERNESVPNVNHDLGGFEDENNPLIRPEGILCNGHARLQSDV
uniref:Fibroblast growth factor receptor n=1 Tax=Phallusia mammillata TaxID=59560 RepID=A0A6F9DD05_9ASCI|nr:FGFR fibroblast growth factor receptor precursor [Phallusia mammillata]